MWIKRKEWEEKCDSNRKLLRDKTEKDQIISGLHEQLNDSEKQIAQIESDRMNTIQMAGLYKERMDDVIKQNDVLMKSNQNLIEWINKIINEVGIYNVEDRRTITIPIYRNPVKAMYGTSEEISNNLKDFVQTEEIIIPEIRFVRMK